VNSGRISCAWFGGRDSPFRPVPAARGGLLRPPSLAHWAWECRCKSAAERVSRWVVAFGVANLGRCSRVVMAMEGEIDIERCVREEYDRLVGLVALVTGSVVLAEDSVQEAFARAWERSLRGQEFTNLPGWVATVALNHARSGWRRQASDREIARRLGNESLGAAVPDPVLRMALRDAVDGLPRRQRDAVVLYYLVDLDVVTVAGLLGVSTGTVKTALARAREKLARLLDDPREGVRHD
jgi:RNA polymerase sigma-70 factor, ECF subfamily